MASCCARDNRDEGKGFGTCNMTNMVAEPGNSPPGDDAQDTSKESQVGLMIKKFEKDTGSRMGRFKKKTVPEVDVVNTSLGIKTSVPWYDLTINDQDEDNSQSVDEREEIDSEALRFLEVLQGTERATRDGLVSQPGGSFSQEKVSQPGGSFSQDKVSQPAGCEEKKKPGFSSQEKVSQHGGFSSLAKVSQLGGFVSQEKVSQLPGFEDKHEPGFSSQEQVSQLDEVARGIANRKDKGYMGSYEAYSQSADFIGKDEYFVDKREVLVVNEEDDVKEEERIVEKEKNVLEIQEKTIVWMKQDFS